MLSDRPLRRHVPTAAGIAALGDDDVLRRHPVSRQWLRLLAERLDGVALVYELAALVAAADPEVVPQFRDCYADIRGRWDDAVCAALGWDVIRIAELGRLLAHEPAVRGGAYGEWKPGPLGSSAFR